MLSENIGKVIQELRKEKKITQEALAEAVGVSSQAVSKWEVGGTPDIALLPAIADFFEISIDKLFGADRNKKNYANAENAVAEYIASLDRDKLFKEWFKLLWAMQASVFRNPVSEKCGNELENMNADAAKNKWASMHSVICCDDTDGMSSMSLLENQRYAFMMPEPQSYSKMLLPVEEYQKLFAALADIDFLNALFFFHRRGEDKKFTAKLLTDNLKLTEEKARAVIDLLVKYKMLLPEELEIDDRNVTMYRFCSPQPFVTFIPFMLFAKEMIQPPNCYCFFMGGRPELD
jgi:transcriptional regulator with XRE-family HTH domain